MAAGALVLAPRLQALDPEGGIGAPAPPHLAWRLGLALVTAQCLALLLRHTAPTAVLLACAAAVPLAAVAGLGDATGVTSMAVLVAAYAVGTRRPIRGAWPAFAATVVVVVVVVAAGTALTGETVGVALAQGIGAIGMPLLVAAWANGRREIREAREGQVQALAREHEARVQAAVADERTAMARELHDIAAHHLSGIAVMTAAIPGQIDTDPAGAKVAVRQVREQSTALLRDLRSLVGLLRDSATDTGTDAHSDNGQPESTDAAGTRTRPETLAGIAPLVEELSHTGPDLQLAVLQRSPQLGSGIGPLAQLAAYRMVQESLANAARHAPGAFRRVTVDDRDPRCLTLTVDNDPSTRRPDAPRASTGGFGLVGMQERAELTGARLRHGATPDGGWRVVLTVPRQEEIA